jgi:5-dehydro-2-deoxygluconokinase
MDPPEDPRLLFYREPEAPDMRIGTRDVDMGVVRDVPILWISASAMSREPSRGTVEAMLAERARRSHTVLDLDWRPMFWASEDEGRRVIGGALDAFTVAVGNRVECEIAVGSGDPDAAASALLDRGIELALIKLGGDGVLVANREARARVPRQDVTVVCGLGAGDAFGGALSHGLLSGWAPERIAEFANAAGAIVASRLLCADAMPTEEEILGLIGVGTR